MPPQTTLAALLQFDPGNSDHLLVRELRVPRTLLALVVGAALAASGVIMQALTRNPLADPGVLGVNAGAAAAVAAGIALVGVQSATGQLLCALLGAALAGALVVLLSGLRSGADPIRVVLVGTALSAVLLALTQLITLNSEEQVFDQFRHWAVGSLQGRGMAVLLTLLLPVGGALLASLLLARALDALVLGEELGSALGARPRLTWLLCAGVIALLAGAATAAAGPIAFVGLTAPHLARQLAGGNHRQLLPVAMLCGALLTLLADLFGRLVAHPGEVSVGIMVALIGGPSFALLARRRRFVL
ncbi:iron ABC transporter permease [Halopseudomonas maritima]|nr:iron ABC transporter permease [Halopseudomonas maritima]